MAFIGEKSTGWSGPLGDFIQELQETPLRVMLTADLTMNSSLTTGVCPRDIPINRVSMERYQSAIEGRTEGGNVQERKGLGGVGGIKTERLWGSGERMHSFIFKVKTVKYKCPIQVCGTPSASLWGASHSPETDHTHKQFITVFNKREETHFCLFPPQKKAKRWSPIYILGTQKWIPRWLNLGNDFVLTIWRHICLPPYHTESRKHRHSDGRHTLHEAIQFVA